MKKTVYSLIFLALIVKADIITGKDIMEKVNSRYDGETLEQTMTMTLINKKLKKRVRIIKVYKKDFDNDQYEVMFFKSPYDVKGTAFLTYDYDVKDDQQYIYLPALKKVKHIPSSDKGSSFMGSDFSYFDLTKRELKKYDFKLIKESKLDKHEVWIIETTPLNNETKELSGYEKNIDIVRKDNYMIIKSIGFLKNGKKKLFNITKMHKEKDIWISDEITMVTMKKSNIIHQTVLQFSNIKIDENINDNLFTIRKIEKGI